ncbi:hypothetical protein YC2023_081393 [Brassica napus]
MHGGVVYLEDWHQLVYSLKFAMKTLYIYIYINIYIYIYVFVSATKTVVTDQMHSWVKCSTRARPDARAGGQTLN